MSVERQHYGVTLAILTVAATAYAVQQTLVFPALPTLQREFDTSAAWVTWVMTAFLLSASVLTPIFGALGDRFGKERLLVLSLCLPPRLAGGGGGAESVDPDRLSRRLGCGWRGIPVELRDHPRRVSTGPGEGRDRPPLRGVRCRQRPGAHRRGLRDRQSLVALAVRDRSGAGRRRDRGRSPLRARVTRSPPRACRRAGCSLFSGALPAPEVSDSRSARAGRPGPLRWSRVARSRTTQGDPSNPTTIIPLSFREHSFRYAT